jgi:hypothetical protein
MEITRIDVGDTFACEAAQLLDDKVLVRREGCWIELRAPAVERLTAEVEWLRTALAEETQLKQSWIDEYVKLRNMGEMPPDEYGKSRQ